MRRPVLRSLLATWSIAASAGCASGDGMQTKFDDATSGYNRYLRWSDFDRAAEYIPRASRAKFLDRHESVRGKLVVLDYEITRLEFDKRRGVGSSRVELSWHTDNRLVVQTTTVDQVWQWHEGDWVLVDEHRTGGTPLSLFPEREEQAHPYLPGLEAFRKHLRIGQENHQNQQYKQPGRSAAAARRSRNDSRD